MKPRVEFTNGTNSPNVWAGAYGYTSEGGITPFEMFAVVRVATEATIQLDIVARMLLDEIKNAYIEMEPKQKDSAVRLEDAMWKMKSKMETLLSKEESIMKNGLDMQIAVAIISFDVLYAAVVGESKVYIYRKDRLVDVSKALVDPSMMGFARTGSLKLNFGDRLVLSTSVGVDNNIGAINDSAMNLNSRLLKDFEALDGACVMLIADEGEEWAKAEAENTLPETEDSNFQLEDKVESVDIESETYLDNDNQHNIVKDIEDRTSDFLGEQPMDEEIEEELDGYTSNHSHQNSFTEKVASMTKHGAGSIRRGFDGVKRRFLFRKNKVAGNADEEQDIDAENFVEDEGEYINTAQDQPQSNREVRASRGADRDKLANLPKKMLGGAKNFATGLKDDNRTFARIIKGLGNLITNIVKLAISWFKKEVIGNPDRRDFYVKSKRRQRNRKLLAIGVVILAIILFFGIRDSENRRIDQEYRNKVTTEIKALETRQLNIDTLAKAPNAQDDAVKTQLLSDISQLNKDVQDKINLLSKDDAEKKKNAQFIANLNRIVDQNTKITDKIELVEEVNSANLRTVADIGKLFPNAKLTDIEFANNNLYVSDSENNVVYKMGSTASSDVNVVVRGLEQPQFMARNADGDIIVVDKSNQGAIGRIYVNDSDRYSRFANTPLSSIGSFMNFDIYSNNDSMYEIRNSPNPYIYRRDREGEGYSSGGANYVTVSPPNWRADSDFANGVDIAVPFEVYVLIKGQGVKRYLSGGENSLNFGNFKSTSQSDYEAIAGATAFDVSADFMAIADPQNKRVMLFRILADDQKNVQFVKQFVYRGTVDVFSNIKELRINQTSQSTGDLFVLDGSRVIVLSLGT